MLFYRYLLIFLFSVAFFLSSSAETFSVTSNADAGANTLREALTRAMANGNSEIDQILFNLPGTTVADRTIILLSALPEITSNVIIDGSSQTGANLGFSGAKISIQAAQGSKFSFFVINKIDIIVEIYGLKLFKPTSQQFELTYGIAINSKSKVTIGAPGKGNVICGFWAGIFGNIGDSKIQSNFIGVLEDGRTPAANLKGIIGRQLMDYLENALIGGEQKNEGNLISGNDKGISFETAANSGTSERISIVNNSFGTDYTETAVVAAPSFISCHIYSLQSVVLTIRKNVFTPNITGLDLFNGTVATVLGNFFGTNRTQDPVFGRANGAAISSNSAVRLIIGSENAGDDNVFTNYNNPISLISSRALVTKNSFYCNSLSLLSTAGNLANDFKILGVYATKAVGKAQPGSLVQLYDVENSCGPCNPKERFAMVTANASGLWEYNGTIKGAIMGTASLNGNSMGFEPITLQDYELKITHFDCRQNGAVELIEKREGNYIYEIKNSNGDVVSTNQNEKNLQPGTYFIELTMVGGCTTRKRIDIFDYTPITFPTTVTLPCNQTEGTFIGNANVPRGATEFYWENENGIAFASTQAVKVGVGKYYFYMKDAVGCITNKSLLTVNAAPLPAIIDDSALAYGDADCGTANGSITQMKVTMQTGTATFSWQNEIGQNVSPGIDLVNAPAGKYRLAIFTNTNCGAIYSSYYMVKEKNGITINETNAATANTKCNLDNGGVSGLVVTGTNLSYVWKDEKGATAGTELELKNVPTGKYYLMVYSGSCNKKSSTFTVGRDVSQPFPNYTIVQSSASCNLENGSIEIRYGAFAPPKSLRWIKDNVTISTNNIVTDLPAGRYDLYLTNDLNCENPYGSYTIGTISPLTVDFGHLDNRPDMCGTNKGAITGIVATGDNPVSYVWKDENNHVVTTTKDLENVKAGNYTLTVSDGLGTTCSNQTFRFTIENETNSLAAPVVPNVRICASGQANLAVEKPAKGSYRLYQNLTDQFPIQTGTNGIFTVDVVSKSSFYISYAIGSCESAKVPVTVTIADKDLDIPSSFSPNGDGINDLWQVKNLEGYPTAKIMIFNRLGNLVYDKTGTSVPFDGTKDNRELPVGVYYYLIELRQGCAILNGSITIIR